VLIISLFKMLMFPPYDCRPLLAGRVSHHAYLVSALYGWNTWQKMLPPDTALVVCVVYTTVNVEFVGLAATPTAAFVVEPTNWQPSIW
jgi:hypothetical protein